VYKQVIGDFTRTQSAGNAALTYKETVQLEAKGTTYHESITATNIGYSYNGPLTWTWTGASTYDQTGNLVISQDTHDLTVNNTGNVSIRVEGNWTHVVEGDDLTEVHGDSSEDAAIGDFKKDSDTTIKRTYGTKVSVTAALLMIKWNLTTNVRGFYIAANFSLTFMGQYKIGIGLMQLEMALWNVEVYLEEAKNVTTKIEFTACDLKGDPTVNKHFKTVDVGGNAVNVEKGVFKVKLGLAALGIVAGLAAVAAVTTALVMDFADDE
jgi:hypothetical protein